MLWMLMMGGGCRTGCGLGWSRFCRSGRRIRWAAIGRAVECPRFGGHLIAWSALSGWAGRMVRYAKGIELSEAVSAGVPA